jgi:hypothetical protein
VLQLVYGRRVQVKDNTAKPAKKAKPSLTVPQLLAVAAFLVFLGLAWFATDTGKVDANWNLNGVEYDQLRTLTLCLIAALLPSDAIIRYGRSILFAEIDDPDKAAEYAPPTTLAQILAVLVYVGVVIAMLTGNDIVTDAEGKQILDVAQVLIIALLPSDAAIRFGRALNLRKSPDKLTKGQLKRV